MSCRYLAFVPVHAKGTNSCKGLSLNILQSRQKNFGVRNPPSCGAQYTCTGTVPTYLLPPEDTVPLTPAIDIFAFGMCALETAALELTTNGEGGSQVRDFKRESVARFSSFHFLSTAPFVRTSSYPTGNWNKFNRWLTVQSRHLRRIFWCKTACLYV